MALAFTCPRGPLLKAVQLCGKVVERRNTIPILANVLLRAEENGAISITGTDLDIWATARLPARAAEVSQPGEITIPAALLADILRKSTDDIRLKPDGKDGARMIVSSGRASFKLNALPAVDFPDKKDSDQVAAFKMTKAMLRRIKEEVSFAISTEETRYYLNGVYLHAAETPEGPTLTAVATDGHRLSRSRLQPAGEAAQMPGIIIPRKMIGLLETIAESALDDEEIAVTLDDRAIVFETEALRFVSKLIDGTFPDYNRVIPVGNTRTYRLDRAALSASVDRCATVSAERGRAARFDFTSSQLTVTVSDPNAGTADETLPLEADGPMSHDELSIGFNAKYALDILGTFKGETIAFALADPGSPTVITDPAAPERTVVLMPMRV